MSTNKGKQREGKITKVALKVATDWKAKIAEAALIAQEVLDEQQREGSKAQAEAEAKAKADETEKVIAETDVPSSAETDEGLNSDMEVTKHLLTHRTSHYIQRPTHRSTHPPTHHSARRCPIPTFIPTLVPTSHPTQSNHPCACPDVPPSDARQRVAHKVAPVVLFILHVIGGFL